MTGAKSKNRSKRSVVWGYFKTVDSASVQCLLCGDCLIRRTKQGRGPTTNMLRHLRVKHTTEVFKKAVLTNVTAIKRQEDMETDGDFCSVEVILEGADSDTITTVNAADINSAINGILKAAQGGPAEQIMNQQAGEYRPVKPKFKKRSLIWRHFEHLDSLDAARCRICRKKLQRYESGSTTNLHRHMSQSHPEVFSRRVVHRQHPTPPHSSQGSNTTVEVVLEGGDSDTITTVNAADINSAINGILEAAQGGPAEQKLHEEADNGLPVKTKCKKRSLIWRHFEHLENLSVARCRICLKHLQCFEGGSTSNLHRHMSTKHPELFSQRVTDGQHPPPPHSSQGFNSKVEVGLEDEDSEILPTENDTDIISSNNGVLETSQGGPAEEITQEEESDDLPPKRPSTKRSLIWRHFVHLKSLGATRCNICMKKLHYDGSTTSNMHRHMSKRHPELFSQLGAGKQHPPPPPHSSQGSSMNGNLSTPAKTVGEMEKQRQISGALKVSRVSEGEKRVFRREMELIEALRRAQREEARALEQQRELLEKLRAVNARETAAEREQMESLRKAQREEAEDLNRQREEVQREKAELQKKWEELRQEREELVLFSRGQQDS